MSRANQDVILVSRTLTRMDTGSFFEALRKAAKATADGTPRISNLVTPGLIIAAQYWTDPVPPPIRTSAGLAVTGR